MPSPFGLALLLQAAAATLPPLPRDSVAFIRVNQVGYRVDAPKVAVVCALERVTIDRFAVETTDGRRVHAGTAREAPGFAGCVQTWRLDFGAVRAPGRYRVRASTRDGAALAPVSVRVGDEVWAGGADTLLAYMRQQRSGYNPFFRDSVHRYDGIVVDGPKKGAYRPTSGGWADAADYLQYVATSATATAHMLLAHEQHAAAFADAHDARGLPGANGVPDVLDEARHGLEWLLRMFPADDEMYNQLGDDRDHAFLDLPTTDSSEYGWGKGKERPLYPCVGRPQGLFRHRNRSTGMASTAGKYATAFALGARAFATRDPAFAARLRARAEAAYDVGRRNPGVCQTAPGTAPYFYEEDDWADDMALAAAQLAETAGAAAGGAREALLRDAVRYAREAGVKRWMGADTAHHYQWFPWVDVAHASLWRVGGDAERAQAAAAYREGLERIRARADNGFRVGIPFIWCSNDLMAAVAMQALLYRRMTGDDRFRDLEQAAIDWLFGANPWGVSMVIGYPRGGRWARDPHSVVAMQLGAETQTGGLLDGPVYASIFGNLKGVRLREADEFARFNTGRVVYHDDLGDYSTNEPIMDGAAMMVMLVSALAAP